MSAKNKNTGGVADGPRPLSSVTPRHSMRATPLAPRPSELDLLEYEGMQRASDMSPSSASTGLEGRTGVLGYVAADAAGTVSSVGDACGGPFADRVHYFAELARLIGNELGFERLTELHAMAETQRIVWTARPEGGWAAALATPTERLGELARALRGER